MTVTTIIKEKQYFPIKTETACQLKWAWSTIYLHLGITASCHRVLYHHFDVNSFDFHNTPQKLDQRAMMLRGEWPNLKATDKIIMGTTTCDRYCGEIERTGTGQSDRQFFANVPDVYPKELDTDLTAINVTPTILEVYIDNTCNLSCLYCIPESSSKIDFEMKKYGVFEKNGVKLESTFNKRDDQDLIEKNFWDWMNKNSKDLKRIQLLGGEPFYQRQFEDFLDFFEQNPCPNLEFAIVSNLMLKLDKLQNYIERIKKLIAGKKVKRLDISASIDCWGPQQEYVRSGLDLAQWIENFEYLVDQRWIKLNINNAINALSIKTMPELIQLLNSWAKDRKIEHYFSKVFEPSYLSIDIFGKEEFRSDFDKILSLMETETWRGDHAKKYMQGIISTVNQLEVNKQEIVKLITFLNEIDRRRNTDWHSLFPWLIKYEDLCGIQE